MTVDIDSPSRKARSFDSLKSQVLEVELLDHLLIVGYLMLSFHDFGIRLQSHLVVLYLSVTECPDIHNMSRHSIVLLSCLINVELVLTVVVLWAKNLVALRLILRFLRNTFFQRLLYLDPLEVLSLLSLLHLDLVLLDTPLGGILDMSNCLFILLELEAAQSEAIVGIWPVLLDFDRMFEPIEGVVILF